MSKRPIVRWLFIASGIIVFALLLAAIFVGAAEVDPNAFTEPSGPSTGERFARPTIVPGTKPTPSVADGRRGIVGSGSQPREEMSRAPSPMTRRSAAPGVSL